MSTPPDLLRRREGHDAGKVTYVELFFDLVFVFAVTQLSHSLIAHYSVEGGLQTLLLLLAVWWAWIDTSWVTNWLDPDKVPVRVALLALMLVGLILSATIPEAFDSRAVAFACAYVSFQVGRSLFFLWAVRGNAPMVRNFQRILTWLLVEAVFWISGAFADGSLRFGLWLIATTLEFIAPAAFFWVPGLGRSSLADWDIDGAHLAERCALFMIIALGESILVTGATFAEMPWTAGTTGAFLASFVGSITMWWLYFDATAESGSRAIAKAHNAGAQARRTYTYIHILLVAGVILTAVADEFVLAHPGAMADGAAVAILGGAALFALGIALFKWSITHVMPTSPWVAIGVLAAMGPFASHVPQLALLAAANAVLIALAIWDARSRRRCPAAVA